MSGKSTSPRSGPSRSAGCRVDGKPSAGGAFGWRTCLGALLISLVVSALARSVFPDDGEAGHPGMTGDDSEWRDLFAGDLAGWYPWLGKPFKPLGLPGCLPIEREVLGANCDPAGVFSLVERNGKKTLRISGQVSGGLITKEAFGDYHFSIKYCWGDRIWPRNLDSDYRDSGILFHCFDRPGEAYEFWMKSVEFQIREDHAGDLWVLDALADAPVLKKRTKTGSPVYRYDLGSPPQMIVEQALSPVKPRPVGEWNQVDIYTLKDEAVYLLNGEVSMVLKNMRKLDEEGGQTLASGFIQLQSAGSEIYFQDARIRSLDAFPIKLRELLDKTDGNHDASRPGHIAGRQERSPQDRLSPVSFPECDGERIEVVVPGTQPMSAIGNVDP